MALPEFSTYLVHASPKNFAKKIIPDAVRPVYHDAGRALSDIEDITHWDSVLTSIDASLRALFDEHFETIRSHAVRALARKGIEGTGESTCVYAESILTGARPAVLDHGRLVSNICDRMQSNDSFVYLVTSLPVSYLVSQDHLSLLALDRIDDRRHIPVKHACGHVGSKRDLGRVTETLRANRVDAIDTAPIIICSEDMRTASTISRALYAMNFATRVYGLDLGYDPQGSRRITGRSAQTTFDYVTTMRLVHLTSGRNVVLGAPTPRQIAQSIPAGVSTALLPQQSGMQAGLERFL